MKLTALIALTFLATSAVAVNRDTPEWQQGWDDAECAFELLLEKYDDCLPNHGGNTGQAIQECGRAVWDNDSDEFVDAAFEESIRRCDPPKGICRLFVIRSCVNHPRVPMDGINNESRIVI